MKVSLEENLVELLISMSEQGNGNTFRTLDSQDMKEHRSGKNGISFESSYQSENRFKTFVSQEIEKHCRGKNESSSESPSQSENRYKSFVSQDIKEHRIRKNESSSESPSQSENRFKTFVSQDMKEHRSRKNVSSSESPSQTENRFKTFVSQEIEKHCRSKNESSSESSSQSENRYKSFVSQDIKEHRIRKNESSSESPSQSENILCSYGQRNKLQSFYSQPLESKDLNEKFQKDLSFQGNRRFQEISLFKNGKTKGPTVSRKTRVLLNEKNIHFSQNCGFLKNDSLEILHESSPDLKSPFFLKKRGSFDDNLRGIHSETVFDTKSEYFLKERGFSGNSSRGILSDFISDAKSQYFLKERGSFEDDSRGILRETVSNAKSQYFLKERGFSDNYPREILGESICDEKRQNFPNDTVLNQYSDRSGSLHYPESQQHVVSKFKSRTFSKSWNNSRIQENNKSSHGETGVVGINTHEKLYSHLKELSDDSQVNIQSQTSIPNFFVNQFEEKRINHKDFNELNAENPTDFHKKGNSTPLNTEYSQTNQTRFLGQKVSSTDEMYHSSEKGVTNVNVNEYSQDICAQNISKNENGPFHPTSTQTHKDCRLKSPQSFFDQKMNSFESLIHPHSFFLKEKESNILLPKKEGIFSPKISENICRQNESQPHFYTTSTNSFRLSNRDASKSSDNIFSKLHPYLRESSFFAKRRKMLGLKSMALYEIESTNFYEKFSKNVQCNSRARHRSSASKNSMRIKNLENHVYSKDQDEKDDLFVRKSNLSHSDNFEYDRNRKEHPSSSNRDKGGDSFDIKSNPGHSENLNHAHPKEGKSLKDNLSNITNQQNTHSFAGQKVENDRRTALHTPIFHEPNIHSGFSRSEETHQVALCKNFSSNFENENFTKSHSNQNSANCFRFDTTNQRVMPFSKQTLINNMIKYKIKGNVQHHQDYMEMDLHNDTNLFLNFVNSLKALADNDLAFESGATSIKSSDSSDGSYICYICNMKYIYKRCLVNHMRKKHFHVLTKTQRL